MSLFPMGQGHKAYTLGYLFTSKDTGYQFHKLETDQTAFIKFDISYGGYPIERLEEFIASFWTL
jgi:hypothetical protein